MVSEFNLHFSGKLTFTHEEADLLRQARDIVYDVLMGVPDCRTDFHLMDNASGECQLSPDIHKCGEVLDFLWRNGFDFDENNNPLFKGFAVKSKD